MRDQVSQLLGKLAFESDLSGNDMGKRLVKINTLIANQEYRAYSWLSDKASNLGKQAEILKPGFIKEDAAPNPAMHWVMRQTDLLPDGVTSEDVAERAGISGSYLSTIRTGRRKKPVIPTNAVMIKLANAFADFRGLDENEREYLVRSSSVWYSGDK